MLLVMVVAAYPEDRMLSELGRKFRRGRRTSLGPAELPVKPLLMPTQVPS